MKTVRIVARPKPARPPREQDLRTPSGRRLPY